MGTLIRTEWLKIKKYPAFWWMAGIVALSYPGINYFFYRIFQNMVERGGDKVTAILKMLGGNPFSFPEAWHTIAYFSSVFVFIPAIVVIMFITNEYTYKTHRQNIIDGWSRKQFMLSKMMDVLIISLLATAIYIVVALLMGHFTSNEGNSDVWSQSNYILLFFIQTLSQLSLAFLIAFLTRKAFIALGIFIFYKIILEKILVALAAWKADDIGRFLPFEISNRLIPVPAFLGRFDEKGYQQVMSQINQHLILTFVLLIATWGLCYWINSKRDL